MADQRNQQMGCAIASTISSDGMGMRFRRGTGKSRLVSRLLGAAACASLLAGMSVSARAQTADPEKIQAQLNALAAQVKELKAELRKQAHEQKETKVKITAVERREVAAGPIVKGPYEPPFWDRSLHLGPVTLTPGGFIEGAGVWRQHSEQADIASTFGPASGGMPLPNNPLYKMTESRFSGRQTRPSLLAQAEVAPGVLVSGYFEFDFLGSAETSNAVESNSYAPRIRNMYVSLDWKDPGVHVLAGQAWTLLMLQGKGLDPRNIVTAPFIDADFIPGQLWERGAQVRFVKDLGPFTAGISFENPQNYYAQCPGASAITGNSATSAIGLGTATGFGAIGGGVDVYCQSPGGQFMGGLQNYSFNRIPDIVGKLAWDGNLGGDHPVHVEAMGYYTDLYDQVAYGGAVTSATNPIITGYTPGGNTNTTGWGVGGGVVATLIPKWLDTEDQVFAGRGIGRFGTSLLPADTFNANGSISPIPEIMFLGSLTAHVTPQLDLWVGGGFEREFADYLSATVGVGDPAISNAGCYTEGGACTMATKEVWQATGGFWYKLYAGDFGTVRWGMQYSYTQRILFPGVGLGGASPTTTDNMVLTALRWYPFDAPPPPPATLVTKY